MNYDYFAFTPDPAVNQAGLDEGLVWKTPDWVGAVPKNAETLEQLEAVKPPDCFIASAALFPDGCANVYVKSSPNLPPVGVIRVRWTP